MASKYIKKFKVPNNFENILNDFAKEVLRNQPKDIIEFAIEYFKALESSSKYVSQKNEDEIFKRDIEKRNEDTRILVDNKLEFSNEDKNRLQNSMDKNNRISQKNGFVPEQKGENERIEKEEKETEVRARREEIEEENFEKKVKRTDYQVKEAIIDSELQKENLNNLEGSLSMEENKNNWYKRSFAQLTDIDGGNEEPKENNIEKKEESNSPEKEDKNVWYKRSLAHLSDIDSPLESQNEVIDNRKKDNSSLKEDKKSWYKRCIARLVNW